MRDRPDDIGLLADHFMAEFARGSTDAGSRRSSRAVSVLQRYPWPGNVRELRNVIERLMIMVPGDAISAAHLGFLDPDALRRPEVPGSMADRLTLHEARDRFERDLILRTLAEQQGNMSRTAEGPRRRAQQPVSEDEGVRDRAVEAAGDRRRGRVISVL